MNISGGNRVTEFILLSFPCPREMQILLFAVFSLTYVLTLMGNGSIIWAVRLDHQLHTPMYILLANFSFLEICYVNTTVPNILANFLSETKTISFAACFLQFYFFFSTGATETFFLSLMAFDRYLAICQPLHYPTIMTGHFCLKLVFLCWVSGFLYFPVPICFMTQLPFCGPNIIDHFLCDPGPLLALSCVPTPGIELSYSILNCLLLFVTFPFILGSYTLVFRAVFKVPSATGRKKAFSTCGSHLIVVSLFYGTLMVMYISPNSGSAAGSQKIFTLFYSVVTPLVNPLIYSLRNKEMKTALRKVQMRIKTIHRQ
ncbi:olfactory receptor 11H6-like [Petaurus breviceps papuanus]|uniref:olfactory receptor 11H6-like n=1 Tax=Petaurus breviceps papuanus TaxID=3040969 RepID=UPI0036DF754C